MLQFNLKSESNFQNKYIAIYKTQNVKCNSHFLSPPRFLKAYLAILITSTILCSHLLFLFFYENRPNLYIWHLDIIIILISYWLHGKRTWMLDLTGLSQILFPPSSSPQCEFCMTVFFTLSV